MDFSILISGNDRWSILIIIDPIITIMKIKMLIFTLDTKLYIIFHVFFYSANLQYTPVDKLLFLKTRMTSRSKYRATLVSCEAGYASFWSIPGENEPLGKNS